MIELPVNNSPEQLFSITLDGLVYRMRIVYNTRVAQWALSIFQDGVPLVQGVPLIGGVDVLQQHNLPIKNMFAVNLVAPELDPDFDGFGTNSKIVILTDAELIG